MADPQQVLEQITETGVMIAMRGAFPPETALEVTEAMYAEGIDIFEFTMNSEQPLAAMQAVKDVYGDSACVGMGTVLDVDTAKQVLDAGADFVVSPVFTPDVVRYVRDAGVMVAPGVMTPTEAANAWALDVPLLKLFPMGPVGVDYFRALAAPLNHMRFICNGGMTPDNVGDFLQAGASACGVSGWLTGNGNDTPDAIRARSKALMGAVKRARGAGEPI